MTTLTFTRYSLRLLRRGDRITAVDGVELARPVVVAGKPGANPPHVPLVKPKGSKVEWRFYPDTQMADQITVERPEPRAQTRTIDGVRFTRGGQYGGWITDDGRFEVWEQEFDSECELPHPARITPAIIALYFSDELAFRRQYPNEAAWAIRTNKRGYQCPGGCFHNYYRWSVWDSTSRNRQGDYASGPGGFITFTEATEWVVRNSR